MTAFIWSTGLESDRLAPRSDIAGPSLDSAGRLVGVGSGFGRAVDGGTIARDRGSIAADTDTPWLAG